MSYLAGPIMLSNPNKEHYLQSIFWQAKRADFKLKNTAAFLRTVSVSVPSFMKENEQMFNWNAWLMKASVQTEHSWQHKSLLRNPVKHHIPDAMADLPTGKVLGKTQKLTFNVLIPQLIDICLSEDPLVVMW